MSRATLDAPGAILEFALAHPLMLLGRARGVADPEGPAEGTLPTPDSPTYSSCTRGGPRDSGRARSPSRACRTPVTSCPADPPHQPGSRTRYNPGPGARPAPATR